MIFYINAKKLKQDDIAGVHFVSAVFIWRVVVWVGWRGNSPIQGVEIATTTFIKYIVHFMKHIRSLISKLKPKATSNIVGKEPENERKSCNINYFM